MTTITGTTDESALDGTDTHEHLRVPELAIEPCRRTRARELSVVSALMMVQLLWLSLLALGIVSLVH